MPKKKTKIDPEINIGLVGHVDHGKTTLVKALSGKWVDTHSEEIKRGITIRLGYANIHIYECPNCKGPEKYSTKPVCPHCGSKTKLVRTISLVDAPGHESLMATMLSGAAIMDGALLLIAANETCPQPQTKEHLMALEIIGIKNIVVIQNKIDTVSKERALESYNEIKEFLKGTSYENAPIIPASAQQNINIDLVLQAIQEYIPTPKRDVKADPLFFVARSFDINPPGTDPTKLKGGILGGAVKQGEFKPGDQIEIRPGLLVDKKGRLEAKPIYSTIVSIKTDTDEVEEATPGGTYAFMTLLDPAIVKSDSLAGNVVGLKGKLPPVYNELTLEVHLLQRVVGSKEELEVEPIRKNEILMLNVNSSATIGIVTDVHKGKVKCLLKRPVCALPNSRVTISRRVGNRFRLIGYGLII
ncbi:MAG: translation initiation factor 2 subunit 3 [Candidatus Woesearchaeota archaeon]|nr:translation initiation factor 2 subunit 3 [Candidatus Woesearchaeota archaeon]